MYKSYKLKLVLINWTICHVRYVDLPKLHEIWYFFSCTEVLFISRQENIRKCQTQNKFFVINDERTENVMELRYRLGNRKCSNTQVKSQKFVCLFDTKQIVFRKSSPELLNDKTFFSFSFKNNGDRVARHFVYTCYLFIYHQAD